MFSSTWVRAPMLLRLLLWLALPHGALSVVFCMFLYGNGRSPLLFLFGLLPVYGLLTVLRLGVRVGDTEVTVVNYFTVRKRSFSVKSPAFVSLGFGMFDIVKGIPVPVTDLYLQSTAPPVNTFTYRLNVAFSKVFSRFQHLIFSDFKHSKHADCRTCGTVKGRSLTKLKIVATGLLDKCQRKSLYEALKSKPGLTLEGSKEDWINWIQNAKEVLGDPQPPPSNKIL